MVADLPDDATDDEMINAIRGDFPNILYEKHFLRRMQERRITPIMIREVLIDEAPEVIDRWDDDPRGRSCMVLGRCADMKPLHIEIACIPASSRLPCMIRRGPEDAIRATRLATPQTGGNPMRQCPRCRDGRLLSHII